MRQTDALAQNTDRIEDLIAKPYLQKNSESGIFQFYCPHCHADATTRAAGDRCNCGALLGHFFVYTRKDGQL